MNNTCYQFLANVLGKDGADALKKSIQAQPALTDVIVPRAILAWLGGVGNYEGSLPGYQNSYLQFKKHEKEYTGNITIGDETYVFERRDLAHLVSAVSISLGVERTPLSKSVKDTALLKIGQSIDLLAKANKVTKALPKVLPKEVKKKVVEPEEESVEKADSPAKTHVGFQPQEPDAPEPPTRVQTSVKSKSALKPLKITKAESERCCSVCDGVQFKDNRFTGCICFSDLAKGIRTSKYSDGYALDFTSSVDFETYLALYRHFRS